MTSPKPILPDHVQRNGAAWDEWAPDFVANGERSWRLQPGDEKWGIWHIPERDVRLLPDDLAGMDAIELGCGTGYVSAWLARRGARPVGIDNPEQRSRRPVGCRRSTGSSSP
jgi:2-polyprenyl-3-methyl-5-hydroxy-6-metoxy-1,4-benzoquinol methylase